MSKRKFTEQEKRAFRKFAEEHAPKSNLWADCFAAFWVGGLICVIGQAISDMYRHFGANEETAKILTPITLVLLSCLLTGFGLYQKIASYAGGGTLVPITGFANAVAAPSIDAKYEGFVLGVGAKMFTIAGPVILYGTAASVVWGVIYYAMNYMMK